MMKKNQKGAETVNWQVKRLSLIGISILFLGGCSGDGGPTISGTGGCPVTPTFITGQVSTYDVATLDSTSTATFTVTSVGASDVNIDVQYESRSITSPVTITYTECEMSLSRELEWYEQLVLFTYSTLHPLTTVESDSGDEGISTPQSHQANDECSSVKYLDLLATSCEREQIINDVAINETWIMGDLEQPDYIVGDNLLYYERLSNGALIYRVAYISNK